ncbi:hypothetical protein D3C80_1560370 [compost metagenome]
MLVQQAVLPCPGVGVVLLHGVHQRACRQPEASLHFLDGIPAIDQCMLRRGDLRIGEDFGVDDQVGGLLRLFHDIGSGAAMVGVLGHEALAIAIHQNALDQLARRIDRGGGNDAIQRLGGGPDGHAELDPGPVVAWNPQRHRRIAHQGHVAADHLVVQVEAASGEDYSLAGTNA